ncbi:MAG: thioredoxin family protein [Verrucomicrobiales bacterium]
MVNKLCHYRLAILLIGSALAPLALPAAENEPNSVATMKEALDLAADDGRLVFVELMAWNCPHCQAFEKTVLDSKVFQEYASESLHLVFYDIKRQSRLTREQRNEIAELIKEHQVKFTPAILVFSPDGALLLETTGYNGTAPEKIVEHLESLENRDD